jgi:hypothetical protein
MPALADQVDNGPMVFPPLHVLHRQVGQLRATQPTGQAEREEGATALAPDRFHVRGSEQSLGLLGGQPVPQADTQLSGSLHSANACSRLWAHQTGIGSFVPVAARRPVAD